MKKIILIGKESVLLGEFLIKLELSTFFFYFHSILLLVILFVFVVQIY